MRRDTKEVLRTYVLVTLAGLAVGMVLLVAAAWLIASHVD